MNRIATILTRAMALYLAWQFAFVMAVLARVDEPQPSLLAAILPAALLGLSLQAGLLWAPSTTRRTALVAALLMVPGAWLTFGGAIEEAQLALASNMHEP